MLQLYQQYQQLPYKPPVTIALALLLVLIYVLEGQFPLMITKWCMCPFYIFSSHHWTELYRIFTSAVIHIDDYHLYYNISSLLWKGSFLEVVTGSKSFIVMTLFLTVVSGIYFLLITSFFNWIGFFTSSYYNRTVGFSGVLFGYKLISHFYNAGPSSLAGIRMPPSYITWVELLYCSLFPNVSFFGHLSGILAGYTYVALPKVFPKLQEVRRRWRRAAEERREREEERSQGSPYHYTQEDYSHLNDELRRRRY
ncbi:hypothetical protein WA577_003934, partial [Blastocystis sp. JDR]